MIWRLAVALALIAAPARAQSVHAPTIVYVGDSLTAGATGTHPYTHYVNLAPWQGMSWTSFNIGVSAKTVEAMSADAWRTLDPLRGAGLSVAVIWAGTNDLANNHAPPDQVFLTLSRFADRERKLGFKVLVMTMISRVGADPEKNPYNAMIRAYWKDFADGLIDIAANPVLGANGAFRNPEFFSDGIHLTDKGYALVGAQVETAVNRAVSGFGADPNPGRQP